MQVHKTYDVVLFPNPSLSKVSTIELVIIYSKFSQDTYLFLNAVTYAGKNFGGFKVTAGLVGGPGAEPPGRRRIFENLQKIPYENCKNAVFSPILQKHFKTLR